MKLWLRARCKDVLRACDCPQACSGLAYSFSIYSVAVTKHLGLNPSQVCPLSWLGAKCCAVQPVAGLTGAPSIQPGASFHLTSRFQPLVLCTQRGR